MRGKWAGSATQARRAASPAGVSVSWSAARVRPGSRRALTYPAREPLRLGVHLARRRRPVETRAATLPSRRGRGRPPALPDQRRHDVERIEVGGAGLDDSLWGYIAIPKGVTGKGGRDDGRDGTKLRFLDPLVTVHARHDQGLDGASILESWAAGRRLAAAARHRTGRDVLRARGRAAPAGRRRGAARRRGRCARTPKGVPHTYRVESEQGARWLVVTSHGDLERFVLSLAQPADAGAVPAPSGCPRPSSSRRSPPPPRARIGLIGPPLS
jgi:hypothetical protein